MKITVHNLERQRLFAITVDANDPPSVVPPNMADGGQATPHEQVILNWEQAVDDHGHLRRCPVCGCRETFARKDFPQVTGFVIVVLAAVIALGLFGGGQFLWGMAVLFAVAIIDAMIFFFTGKCQVCYRCRSEFRALPIARDHPAWELAIGEKYRQASMKQKEQTASCNTDNTRD